MSDSSMLQDWLPTKLSRRIALLTLTVASGGAALVRFLRPLLPKVTEAELVLLQSTVWLLFALVGTWLALFFVVRAYNLQVKNHATEVAALNEQHETKINLANSKSFKEKIDYPPLGII
jgi:predicted membrane protein